MRHLLVRLYPARWRDRYGDEFEALLEERPLGPFDVADVILGAIDARLHQGGRSSAHRTERGFSMSLRIAGLAAALGAPLWVGGFVVARATATDTFGGAAAVLLLAGSLALLVALVGLSAFQARTHPALSWAALAIPAIGTIALGIGALGAAIGRDLSDVFFFGLLTFFVGTVLFAVATLATGVLSRAGAGLLVLGPILAVASGGSNEALTITALICFALGWIAMGLKAIRLDRMAPSMGSI